MSIKSKIALLISILIMLVYFVTQTLIVFHVINHSDNIDKFGYFCFISFIPPFLFFLSDYISGNIRGKKLSNYTTNLNNCLILLTRNDDFFKGDLLNGGKKLTKAVSDSIFADRCSIWLYNDDKSSIICQDLYVKSDDKWYSNIELFEKDFKQYFYYLDINPIIIANDAENHPATSCFKDIYLSKLGIKSMLDVPIYYKGDLIGVICIESLSYREWLSCEVNFAQLLSSIYSFAFSVKDSNRLSNDIAEFENFVDSSVLISKADKNGKITYVNQKFSEVSGWSLEDATGKDHKIVNSGFHPKEMWEEMYKTTIKDKKIWNAVVTNKSKDGHLYWVDSYIKAEFEENGDLKGFMSIRYDVSEVKKKELEIRNRMNAINQSNAVIEFDLNGNIMYANKNFCDTMGYLMEEITGKHHSIFLTDDYSKSLEYKEFWNVLKNGNFISTQFMRIKKNGDKIWLQATYNPIFDNDGRVIRIMKIAIDITEKVLQSQEIEKKNTYLEHAAKILRHDMHSGINTYMPRGLSSLERRLKTEDIENLKIEAPIKMIKEGLRHSQKVYRGVYEFTNLVKKDVVLNKSICDLSSILKDYLSSTAYSNQVNIEDLGIFEVNEPLFCTALDNLIRNGLKYNDSNSKLVKIYRVENILYVEDNGRGMSQKDFDILKQPYTRKEGQKETGTGLGLNICIAILEEHGFTITCDKMNEGGTQLKINLKV
jgi:PAS domain S-box-containing protein